MKEKSFGERLKWGWVYLIIAFVVVSVGLLVMIMLESNRLRLFKVDMFVLCNESSICIADGPDGKVRVNSENWNSINSLIEKTHGSITFGTPKESDAINFEFLCHDTKWNLAVHRINDKKIRLHLTGDREYVVYIKNNGVYDSFVKAASVKSFNTENKKMP